MSGLMIAAPASGSGKTVVTLGLMRALKRRSLRLAPGKAGPDYIDPAFHSAASGETCFNFDPWAMRPEFLLAQAESHGSGRLLLIEAMMGLFDGAADGSGSAGDLAALLGLPVVLVVDCAKTSQSVAALVQGFAAYRADVRVAGVILNRVGSDRHEAMLRMALDAIGMPVLGAIRSDAGLALPERHLGLVQASEHAALETFVGHAADVMERCCDLDLLVAIADRASGQSASPAVSSIAPIGQHVAIARDMAFAFSYAHLIEGWRGQGAEVSFFSPLADEAPAGAADAVYLPGGYPELHAGPLSSAARFSSGMLNAAARGTRIYGECGGYMVLGDALIDGEGASHAMLGLLPLVTSYAVRKRHLGYRRVTPVDTGCFAGAMTAHEFHYSTVVAEGDADRLFTARDALDNDLGAVGLRRGKVCGSYMHLVDITETGT
ncbi:cobyrinate a,c-diamide synthase [Rhizobium sp. SL42]|uniref:cobyrinate a,c-diamide synthase n=1 Tax=Rhizobium sp. SL42 TaxID=2806346 RepID=UPI001F007E2D|nr:cobyrinate a,c-diamide synthase [Rhizobium sp. SL42]UJW73877.1 cobyrinate a,c-diamide synthase [Rhizobium sp. SL42]